MAEKIERVQVSAFRVPTEAPESDGTLEWSETTLVVAEISAGGSQGLGYTYADVATAVLIRDRLGKLLVGMDPMDIPAAWDRLVQALRNLGVRGIGAMAISALDVALWDWKARKLALP